MGRKRRRDASLTPGGERGRQMVVSALIASLNPAINPRQNSGSDSQEVRAPAGRPCR